MLQPVNRRPEDQRSSQFAPSAGKPSGHRRSSEDGMGAASRVEPDTSALAGTALARSCVIGFVAISARSRSAGFRLRCVRRPRRAGQDRRAASLYAGYIRSNAAEHQRGRAGSPDLTNDIRAIAGCWRKLPRRHDRWKYRLPGFRGEFSKTEFPARRRPRESGPKLCALSWANSVHAKMKICHSHSPGEADKPRRPKASAKTLWLVD